MAIRAERKKNSCKMSRSSTFTSSLHVRDKTGIYSVNQNEIIILVAAVHSLVPNSACLLIANIIVFTISSLPWTTASVSNSSSKKM